MRSGQLQKGAEQETSPPDEFFERPTVVGGKVLTASESASPKPSPPGRGAVGLTWADVLRLAKPTVDVKLRAVVETLNALSAIHTNLVRPPAERCHGALNPQLVLVTADGKASVFWHSLHGLDPSRLEPYIAPEVRAHSPPDQQADIYSVGVMLYEAVTGSMPEKRRPISLDQRGMGNAWLSSLLQVTVKALDPDPRRRWHSALVFAEELSRRASERLATQADLGRIVARAVSQQERILRAHARKLSSGPPRLPPPPAPPTLSPGSPRVDTLAAAAISQTPGLDSLDGAEVHTFKNVRPRRRRLYAYSAGALLLAISAGLWLARHNAATEVAEATRAEKEPRSEIRHKKPEAPQLQTPSTKEAPAVRVPQESNIAFQADTIEHPPPADTNNQPASKAAAPKPKKAARSARPAPSAPKVYEPEGI